MLLQPASQSALGPDHVGTVMLCPPRVKPPCVPGDPSQVPSALALHTSPDPQGSEAAWWPGDRSGGSRAAVGRSPGGPRGRGLSRVPGSSGVPVRPGAEVCAARVLRRGRCFPAQPAPQRCGRHHSAGSPLPALLPTKQPRSPPGPSPRGRQVFFYKRAQIFVADVWGAFGGGGPGAFHDVQRLTMFADYRVPAQLRTMGILHYATALAEAVDAGRELPAGGEAEVEIRAATVEAVELMRGALAPSLPGITSVTLDWWLWEAGEAGKDAQSPHHRTLVPYY